MGALFRQQQVLLCHRSPDRRWYPDVWDFPGGHVEDGETPRSALVRELREELGIEAHPGAVPDDHVVAGDVHLSVWRLDSWAGEPVNAAPDEHDDLRWFSLADVLQLRLAHPGYPDLLRALSALPARRS